MFSRVFKASQTLLPSSVRAGITRCYSTSSGSSDIIDNIYHFNQDKTRQALTHVHTHGNLKQKVDLTNLLILDSISETPFSTTNRAFDHNNKQFLAVKTLRLDSAREWNQVNLALRQYSFVKPTLGKVLGMDYNEQRQEVKIFSELGNLTTLGDYCHFRIKHEQPWTNSEMRLLYWNIVNQLNTLRELGGVCETIKPKNLFYDTDASILKLYDLSDFDALRGAQGFSLDEKIPINLDSAVYSLVQAINPYAPVHDSEEARAYLRTNHPEFFDKLEQIQMKIKKWRSQKAEVARSQIEEQIENLQTELDLPAEWFEEDDYETFFFNKMEQVRQDIRLSKSSKEWADLNYEIGNDTEGDNAMEKNWDKTFDSQAKDHKKAGKIQADKVEENVDKALKSVESQINRLIIGKLEKSFNFKIGGGKEASKDTKTDASSSSSSSKDKSGKLSVSLWELVKIFIVLKLALFLLEQIGEDTKKLDPTPNQPQKEEQNAIREPNSSQTNSTTVNNSQTASATLNNNQNKQRDIKGAIIFGAIMLVSAYSYFNL